MYCPWNNMSGNTKMNSRLKNMWLPCFCISKVSHRRETYEFRQSIVNIFVSWDSIAVRGKLMSPSPYVIFDSKVFETPNRLISWATVFFVIVSTERNKASYRTPGLAPLLIPWFTRFTLLSDNVVACKREYKSVEVPVEVLTGFHRLETGLFCLLLPRFSHLSYLMLLTQYKSQYWRGTIRTRGPFIACLYENFEREHEISVHTSREVKRGLSRVRTYKEAEFKAIPNAIVY